MRKSKNILSVIAVTLMCLVIPLSVFAKDNNELVQKNARQVDRISYVIYDSDGKVQSEGNLPMNKKEAAIQPRDYWGSKTINPNGYMYLYRQSDGFPFFLTAGSRVYLEFGLNRDAYITSAIVRNPGEFITHESGLTGGRVQSAIVQLTGNHHGYIYNTDPAPVTVTYASFTTAY